MRPFTRRLSVIAFLASSPVMGQPPAAEPPRAGASEFAAAALNGCDTDLIYLNQMFGWQVRWPAEWQSLATADEEAVRAAIVRWREAPAALAADLAALRRAAPSRARAPGVVVDRVLAQVTALHSALRASAPPLQSGIPVQLAAEWRRLFAEEIVPALARYENYLRSSYRPGPADGLGDGACFGRAATHFTSLDLPAEAIEQTGRRLLRETEVDLARLHGIAPAEVPALLERLRGQRDPAYTADRLVEVSRAALARADAAMSRMFSGPSRAPMIVEPMAPAMEASFPAGFYRLAEEGRPAAYVINRSRPADRQLMAEVIAFHEGLPGHHITAALGIPRGEFNSGFLEGWALYSEYLADEMGLYGGPADRTGMMAKHLWAASRLVVEPGLHLRGWTRAQAIDFMRRHTVLPLEEIEIEVDRYIALPGQSLSYMLGYERIAAARRYAEERLGDRFDLRRFHDIVLGPGSRPLERMYADVVRWADGGGRG